MSILLVIFKLQLLNIKCFYLELAKPDNLFDIIVAIILLFMRYFAFICFSNIHNLSRLSIVYSNRFV